MAGKVGAPLLEEEFLAELRQLERGKKAWLLQDGKIRTYQRGSDGWLHPVCPICAVYTGLIGGYLTDDYEYAGWGLGIPDHLRRRIATASDNREGHDELLRRRLLEACGLTTKKP